MIAPISNYSRDFPGLAILSLRISCALGLALPFLKLLTIEPEGGGGDGDEKGTELPGGVYFLRLTSTGLAGTAKLVLVR